MFGILSMVEQLGLLELIEEGERDGFFDWVENDMKLTNKMRKNQIKLERIKNRNKPIPTKINWTDFDD